MSKESYRKRLIDLRTAIANEREAKKRDNANYVRLINGASSATTKAFYRKSKIDRAAAHDRRIADLKRQVETTRSAMRSA